MLERTAASLEPCNFQRVLPPTKLPFKSRRRLHTAFWQHGAADIELSNVWHALLREPLESLSILSTPQSAGPDSSNPSIFLLDFLYPQGATSLLRKLSPSILDKYGRPRLHFRGAVPRLFTASASPSQQQLPSPPGDMRVASEAESPSTQDEVDRRADDVGEETELGNEGAFDETEKHTREDTPHDGSTTWKPSPEYVLGRLRDLLRRNQEADFNDVWQAYHAKVHSRETREVYRPQFLDYITKYRSKSSLLALCLKFHNLKTVWDVWARFPEAHSSKALNFDDIERYISVNELMKGLIMLIRRVQHLEKVAIPGTDPELSKSLMSHFIYPCIHRYTRRCHPDDYFQLLKLLKDPILYEDFIGYTSTSHKFRLANDLYKQYRQLPDVKIRGHIMHKMIELVYIPTDDAAGMELVLVDFYGRFGRLDIGAYRRYMEFYARRGDVKSVQRLWGEYTTYYAEERKPKRIVEGKTLSNKPDFLPMLHVHAVRGELGQVRRIFSQAQTIHGSRLNVVCWNILLNAHAKAGAYDAAVRVFGVMRQAVSLDLYSYGTMMGMTGSRGDLEFTLELYRMAKNDGLKPNVTMVDCVVEAYCQNDKYNDAKSIVEMTTQKGRFSRKELAILWNTLLYHHGMRHDLVTVNETLGEMTRFRIGYDGETYAHLLRGLALCRQPHHALYLVQEAVRSKTWKPTLQHYALLMSSFIRSGQPRELLRTSTILRGLGLPQNGEMLLKVLQALGQWATRHKDASKSRAYLVSALRQFRRSIEWDKEPHKALLQRRSVDQPWVKQAPDPPTVSLRNEQASVLIFTFTQMREFTTVQDVLDLWHSSSPETSDMPEPPLKLLEALMLSAFYQHSFEEVQEIWDIIFNRVLELSRVAAPGMSRAEPLPSMRYILTDALKTMQRTYAAQDDADGLRKTITKVLRAGFRLDSKNWNYYVQFLVSMKKWREAFMVCEEQLMPYWRGWQRVRAKVTKARAVLPLEMRRKGMNPHLPRPISYTLMVLSKAYMDLEQMAAWSTEAERLLKYIVSKCPSAISAVTTQLRSSSPLEEKLLTTDKATDAKEQRENEAQKKDEED
ncbi:hypothetical protein M406DRAFT_215849, partial [Cryphonectria parasitica EP155]